MSAWGRFHSAIRMKRVGETGDGSYKIHILGQIILKEELTHSHLGSVVSIMFAKT